MTSVSVTSAMLARMRERVVSPNSKFGGRGVGVVVNFNGRALEV